MINEDNVYRRNNVFLLLTLWHLVIFLLMILTALNPAKGSLTARPLAATGLSFPWICSAIVSLYCYYEKFSFPPGLVACALATLASGALLLLAWVFGHDYDAIRTDYFIISIPTVYLFIYTSVSFVLYQSNPLARPFKFKFTYRD